MRTRFLAACISWALLTASGFAQPPHSSQATAQEKERPQPVVFTAIVTGYKADKTLQLDAKGKAYSYELSQTEVTFKIDTNIRVGGTVQVTDGTDVTGHRTVTVTAVKVGN